MTIETRPPGAVDLANAPTPIVPFSTEMVTPTADGAVDPAVVANRVGKRFGDTDVVKDLSFVVKKGTIFGIIGPSGGGKTTTMRMLLGVLKPTSGDLRVSVETSNWRRGPRRQELRPPDRFRRRERERLGYLPQLFALFPELSVTENLNFAASIYGTSIFGRGKRIRQILDFVELWDARSKTAGQLSGGMQRRLGLAATLIHNPQIIFLDEPTAGIDPVLRAKIWEHFRELRDQGRTLIVTTQYVTESEYCDEIAVLKEGRLVATGTPEDVRRQAMGGDAVNVSGPELGRRAIQAIAGVDGYIHHRRLNENTIQVIVEDGSRALPLLVDALRDASVEVDTVAEERPTFDDVFVRLMEQEDDRAGTG